MIISDLPLIFQQFHSKSLHSLHRVHMSSLRLAAPREFPDGYSHQPNVYTSPPIISKLIPYYLLKDLSHVRVFHRALTHCRGIITLTTSQYRFNLSSKKQKTKNHSTQINIYEKKTPKSLSFNINEFAWLLWCE